jgi:hypothetical protein
MNKQEAVKLMKRLNKAGIKAHVYATSYNGSMCYYVQDANDSKRAWYRWSTIKEKMAVSQKELSMNALLRTENGLQPIEITEKVNGGFLAKTDSGMTIGPLQNEWHNIYTA